MQTVRVKNELGRWNVGTPAMDVGLADHVWSIREWVSFPAKPGQVITIHDPEICLHAEPASCRWKMLFAKSIPSVVIFFMAPLLVLLSGFSEISFWPITRPFRRGGGPCHHLILFLATEINYFIVLAFNQACKHHYAWAPPPG